MLDTCARFLRPALIVSTVVITTTVALEAREKSLPKALPRTAAHAAATAAAVGPSEWDAVRPQGMDKEVFKLALHAANCAVQAGTIADPSTLTVIDYSRPSTSKRLWVLDLHSREVLYEELVAHGQGSGANVPTAFSNEAETHRSSIGLFETKDTYIGRNGYSLRLEGLDAGFNDRAFERAIVMHGAPYVSETVVKKQGRLGRSWGCPAVRESVARELIDHVKGAGLVFAYYPDPEWLSSSKFLGDCSAQS
jgi:L,D-transpeptidase-like protein